MYVGEAARFYCFDKPVLGGTSIGVEFEDKPHRHHLRYYRRNQHAQPAVSTAGFVDLYAVEATLSSISFVVANSSSRGYKHSPIRRQSQSHGSCLTVSTSMPRRWGQKSDIISSSLVFFFPSWKCSDTYIRTDMHFSQAWPSIRSGEMAAHSRIASSPKKDKGIVVPSSTSYAQPTHHSANPIKHKSTIRANSKRRENGHIYTFCKRGYLIKLYKVVVALLELRLEERR